MVDDKTCFKFKREILPFATRIHFLYSGIIMFDQKSLFTVRQCGTRGQYLTLREDYCDTCDSAAVPTCTQSTARETEEEHTSQLRLHLDEGTNELGGSHAEEFT